MAIDTQTLTQLITEFRSLTAKDSITPESLGSILQRIADLLATAGTSDTVTKIQELLNGFSAAGYAITSIAQGSADRNNINATISKVSLTDGTQSSASGVFIQQATTERAGAMRAQQVTDLNQAKSNILTLIARCTALETALTELQSSITNSTSSTSSSATISPISCRVVDGVLNVFGAAKYTNAGYVPYLFRWSSKRNRYHHRVRTEGNETRQYCSKTKGWHLYGSRHSVQLNGTKLMFSTSNHSNIHEGATSYTTAPEAIITVSNRDRDNFPQVAWGRSLVCMYDTHKKAGNYRLLRFRIAVAFGPAKDPGSTALTPADMVSPLAEFYILFDPYEKKWLFCN
jgi:hypothetical protein